MGKGLENPSLWRGIFSRKECLNHLAPELTEFIWKNLYTLLSWWLLKPFVSAWFEDLCNLPHVYVNLTGFFLFLSILLACSFTLPSRWKLGNCFTIQPKGPNVASSSRKPSHCISISNFLVELSRGQIPKMKAGWSRFLNQNLAVVKDDWDSYFPCLQFRLG